MYRDFEAVTQVTERTDSNTQEKETEVTSPAQTTVEFTEDLSVRIEAASAVRRLGHSIVSRQIDALALREIVDQLEVISAVVDARPIRGQRSAASAPERFIAGLPDDALGQLASDTALIELFHKSPVSGAANPLSMGLRLSRDGTESVGQVTLEPGWEGAPGRAHGGIVAACVDETIGGLLPILGVMAFTGRLDLRYVAPCPLGVLIEFRARLASRTGRKLDITCDGQVDGVVFVASSARFIAVDPSHVAR